MTTEGVRMLREWLQKAWRWLDFRFGFQETLLPLLTHRVPRGARWWYIFGSMTAGFLLLQIVTGICLLLVYVPSADRAYDSLQALNYRVTLGWLLRALHNFGASGMVVMVVIHMTQVFLMGGHKYPRVATWLVGVGLLACTLGMAFSGQVLRWDLGDNLTPCLTPEQVAAQGVPLETARGTILSVIAGAQGVPVYATCAAEGKLLVWKIPASGPAEFIGDAQKLAGGPIVQLAARPDGQQWAALIGGAASPAATDKSAPGQAGSAPPAPAAAAAVLYLTGPNFSSPQKVDLQGKAPADLAYSANGRLYFVVDSTQIWKITPGQPPAELAEGPPQDSLKAVTPK